MSARYPRLFVMRFHFPLCALLCSILHPLYSDDVSQRPAFGTDNHIEYIPGTLPIIIGAPHGGSLTPDTLPDRDEGKVLRDGNTQEIARELRDDMLRRYGAAPHLIVCLLHRKKVDCNREIKEAAQGNPAAERAHSEFHSFISQARAAVEKKHSAGLYLDMHGQRHKEQLVEFGYFIPASKINLSDAELEAATLVARQSSVRELDARSPQSFVALLRGPQSLGALLEARGIPSIPSPAHPSPGTTEYYSGAYDIETHGSLRSGTISAVQVEMPWVGVRDTKDNRARFVAALSESLGEYFAAHFKMPLGKKLGGPAQ